MKKALFFVVGVILFCSGAYAVMTVLVSAGSVTIGYAFVKIFFGSLMAAVGFIFVRRVWRS